MKINWKIIVAGVVLVAVASWGFDSLRIRSYSGTELNFGIGGGPVTVTNSSDATLPVQLVGTGSRTFSISSAVDGVSGSSTRQGSGRSATQLYEFTLPSGVSEFSVERGVSVNLITDADSSLDVTVQPLANADAQTTLIIAAIVILGALFYISRATGHSWISLIRGGQVSVQESPPAVEPTHGQGRVTRSVGDNRAKTQD